MRNFNRVEQVFYTLIFVLSINAANAQSIDPNSLYQPITPDFFYIGGSVGFTGFWGDITSINSATGFGAKMDMFKEPQFGANFNFGYQFSAIFGSRLNMTTGSTKSSNDTMIYEGKFTDFSIQLTIDITRLVQNNFSSRVNIYSYVGIGLMTHSTHSTDNKFIITSVFPVGLGVRYAVSKNIFLVFETGLHYSGSDLLDQIPSTVSPNFYKMDGVKFTSIGLTYRLNDINHKTHNRM